MTTERFRAQAGTASPTLETTLLLLWAEPTMPDDLSNARSQTWFQNPLHSIQMPNPQMPGVESHRDVARSRWPAQGGRGRQNPSPTIWTRQRPKEEGASTHWPLRLLPQGTRGSHWHFLGAKCKSHGHTWDKKEPLSLQAGEEARPFTTATMPSPASHVSEHSSELS